jgi:hypothetical protein
VEEWLEKMSVDLVLVQQVHAVVEWDKWLKTVFNVRLLIKECKELIPA